MTDRIARPAEAVIITGRSLASIHRDEKVGRFPKRIRIGQNAVGYLLSELYAWLEERANSTEPVKQVCPGVRKGLKPSVKEG